MQKQEEIENFRNNELPYYQKLVSSEEPQNYFIEKQKKKIGIKRQMNKLSDILFYQDESIRQLQKIINIKAEEIKILKEKVEKFSDYIKEQK